MIFFFSCEKQEDIILHVPCEGDDCIIYETSPYPTPTPNGFPLMIIPDDNPLTFEGVALGKKLFFDPILSSIIVFLVLLVIFKIILFLTQVNLVLGLPENQDLEMHHL